MPLGQKNSLSVYPTFVSCPGFFWALWRTALCTRAPPPACPSLWMQAPTLQIIWSSSLLVSPNSQRWSRRKCFFTVTEGFSVFDPLICRLSHADVGAAYVLLVPRLHVRSAVDHLLWAGSCHSVPAEPEPDRVFIRCHPDRPGILEPGHTKHPAAYGSQ